VLTARERRDGASPSYLCLLLYSPPVGIWMVVTFRPFLACCFWGVVRHPGIPKNDMISSCTTAEKPRFAECLLALAFTLPPDLKVTCPHDLHAALPVVGSHRLRCAQCTQACGWMVTQWHWWLGPHCRRLHLRCLPLSEHRYHVRHHGQKAPCTHLHDQHTALIARAC
jgi:hypothetical protein